MLLAQSPHGDDLKINCAACHSSAGWDVVLDTFQFSHDSTKFMLEGQHDRIDCKSCHEALVFENAQTECISCHTDIHNQTVGMDCARCHTPENWLVDQITGLHQENGFPLLGAHAIISCNDCHTSETILRFDRIGNECINCHFDNYIATTEPDHQDAGYSTNCIECHDISGFDWTAANTNHDFFPLERGHKISNCTKCHDAGTFSNTPSDCASCHQPDFDASANPDHQDLNFTTDCVQCHTIDPDWIPAQYKDHDGDFFSIYSGSHQGEWDQCTDCHTDPSNYAVFSCTICHTNPETDNKHNEVGGYVYDDPACLACHPTGNGDDSFDHNLTNFALTGAHTTLDCIECHADGYQGTPTDCAACHTDNFDQTTNPNHIDLALPTDCAACHTTDPDWVPASFDVHDDFYKLNGAHADIANDCASCHDGDYNNTPNDCAGCHTDDFNNTTNPGHEALQFSTDCKTCHTENEWVPSTFDHDGQYFPIFSGKHEGEWDQCIDCHSNPSDFSIFTCINCHTNPQTDNEHDGVNNYSYNDEACLACHPTGDADFVFDHNSTAFPLTGGHTTTECVQCHTTGYPGTPTDCAFCHTGNFNQTGNPDHNALAFPTDCASCHTTEPGWNPASFANHNSFYALNGAHATIANDCAVCHNGDYNDTPNDCAGCHTDDFINTTNPNHTQLQFSTDCTSCHSENAWQPATFDHDGQYFPIYSGKHAGEWSECIDCHTNASNYSVFTCITCHTNPETDNQHNGVNGYSFDSPACLACHPTGDADLVFDHNSTAFQLTGAHTTTECLDCHASGYVGTPAECASCHTANFEQTTNPGHTVLGFSTDCVSCHTTEPEWNPAAFADHNNSYALNGTHATIANDCAACHNGNYNSTPNTCDGCHTENYNQTTNPNHAALQFSTDCTSCHNEDAWTPSTFDHDGQYFPINSGKHEGEWSECVDCHTNPSNYSVFTCITCHANPETDNQHNGVNGYSFDSPACLACHPTGDADLVFDHNSTAFPLTGSHTTAECLDCHASGYVGTPAECASCHTANFEQTTNPNHMGLGFSTDCTTCHTTEPDWNPATFADHDNSYALNGTHATIANDCAACHNGNYNITPSTCNGCHADDFSQTTNPNHAALQFSTDCTSCHNEDAWVPSAFDHDGQYFPIYSSKHEGEWSECVDCHTNPSNYTVFTCVTCHANPETDNQHNGVNGYSFDSPACLACHPTGDADLVFDHNSTAFPLTGAHTSLDCVDCHSAGYQGTPTDCASCHTANYNQTTNPGHAGLGLPTDCQSCHTTESGWSPASFADHDSYFVLDGAHADIANDCAACHSGNYNNTPNTCVGCHHDNFDQTTNPDHPALSLPTDCATCHTTEPDWMPATFADHDNFFALVGAHAGIANDCAACHNGNYNNTPNTCDGCHQDNYNQTTNPNHISLQFPTDCNVCHDENGWTPSTFDHSTVYPFTGAHEDIANDCAACHNGNYNNTPNTCEGCHQANYDQTSNPDHAALSLPADCASCHTTEPGWSPATFAIHNNFYTLNGAHASIANDCAACHNGNYNNTPNTCAGCHEDNYNQTTNPNHAALQFPMDCQNCHTEAAWSPSNFDHSSFYPFNGAHQDIANDCNACHNGNYNNTPNTCAGCHQANYDQTTNPNHINLAFPTDCTTCHTTNPGWNPATFADHDNYYILDGAHADISNDCAACHNGNYNSTPNTCDGCHTGNYNQSTNPNHVNLAFPTDCATCHTTDPGWNPATFTIHDNYYVLDGAHADIATDCAACHNGNYNNTPNTCEGCHQAGYDQTTNPDHAAINIPTDCETCHTTTPGWNPATFPIHDNYFVLDGAHLPIANDCATCHNGNYNNTPNTCEGCHIDDYNQTTNPNHVTLGIPTDCTTCHTTQPEWNPATFPIHSNYYVLNGAHAAIANDCAACHNGNYNNTTNTCFGCHADDYNQTTNPNHLANQFPTDCQDCHTETAWVPSTFDHNNFYPLTGAHIVIANDCNSCHNGNYNNTPNTCEGCHIDDYNQTTNPNHVTLAIPTDCAMCHTTDPDWNPATFPIHSNYYVLNGAHAAIQNDCAACHNGNYNNTPNTCFGCHESNYNNANNPNHAAAQFPTTCEDCHSETAWVPSTWDHDNQYFPIYSGKHEGEWNQCVECHTIPGNFTAFSCIDCHEHDDPVESADDHQGVSGYSYSSPACYSCHPAGEAD
jgi:hypothetical protein